MESKQSSPILLIRVLASMTLMVAASCTSSRPPEQVAEPLATSTEVIACGALSCNISTATWTHIQQRHCTGCAVGDRSAFVAAYCANQAAAVTFCTAVLASASCAATRQSNGRIAATADLGHAVGNLRAMGCPSSTTGTVIFANDGGSVVTQFPGTP